MPFTKGNNTMKKLILILLCLPLLFSSCNEKPNPNLELNFQIGDKADIWKQKLNVLSSDTAFVIENLEQKTFRSDVVSISYLSNEISNIPNIPIKIELNNGYYYDFPTSSYQADLWNHELISIDVELDYEELDIDYSDLTEYLEENYGFSNSNQINKWNDGLQKKKEGKTEDHKKKLKRLEKNSNCIEELLAKHTLDWNANGNLYTLYSYGDGWSYGIKKVYINIVGQNYKKILAKIKEQVIPNYTANDYVHIIVYNFRNLNNISNKNEITFQIDYNTKYAPFDDRAFNKVKYDLLFLNEFKEVLFTEERIFETNNESFYKSEYQNLTLNSDNKNIAHVKARVKSVILHGGKVISR